MNDSTAKLHRLFAGPGPIPPVDIIYALALTGLTQADIGRQCGVHRVSVHEVIHGKSKSFDIASALAAALDTTVRKLFGDSYDYAEKSRRPAAAKRRAA